MYTFNRRRQASTLLAIALVLLVFTGCGAPASGTGMQAAKVSAATQDKGIVLTIGAYSVVRDAMAEILPAFKAHWEAKTGQSIEFLPVL